MYLNTCFDQYMAFSDNKKRNFGNKFENINLFLGPYNYDDWPENKESTDTTRKSDKEESVDLSDMSSLKDEE